MHLHHVTATHWLPNASVHLLGAVDCVTGASTRVECGGAALVVDCGIAQGAEAHRWSLPSGMVDALVETVRSAGDDPGERRAEICPDHAPIVAGFRVG